MPAGYSASRKNHTYSASKIFVKMRGWFPIKCTLAELNPRTGKSLGV